MIVNGKHYRTVWIDNGVVHLIDQPKIPHRFGILKMKTHRDTADAISTMIVRGAGAIGATGAAGMAQAHPRVQAQGRRPYRVPPRWRYRAGRSDADLEVIRIDTADFERGAGMSRLPFSWA